jgi:hypothetical protein
MTIKLQNEKGEQEYIHQGHEYIHQGHEYIHQAHGDGETPDVVGHASATSLKSRLSQRGEDAATEDGEGRLSA